jgi:hypothetical protein
MMTAWQLVNRIHTLLGERHKDAIYEGIITADMYAPISGILVANEPSVEAIRLAVATGKIAYCVENILTIFLVTIGQEVWKQN